MLMYEQNSGKKQNNSEWGEKKGTQKYCKTNAHRKEEKQFSHKIKYRWHSVTSKRQ
jgi:hypothetical protein